MTIRARLLIGVVAWCLAAGMLLLPLVWLINNRDWGVGLMLLTPLAIYALMRLGRRLENWAKASAPPDYLQPAGYADKAPPSGRR